MSMVLPKFAESFVNERLTADIFADAYIELWNIERDLGLASQDAGILSQVNSTIFLMADLYNPESDRDDYEFDEEELRLNVKQELEKLKEEGYPINFI
ncbi:colicin immunity domain-containing protein [Psychrobacter sp. FDAARGOS_221]|uniref:colicin immunity domain-containing protein n=1 Tax=Psychrobacter sp. FDAARGOS_221 TaxID=1975705 RepID=UPI000BB55793|nr:colicin immunity domain-containing protein [Psychrobacter sp. FDAARGOS_221]PNK60970.1 colicin immunity protein [Psychrobacter sp. FDAARGOS_221]